MKLPDVFSVGFASVMTGVTALLGGYDLALRTLLICVALDICTGILKAIINKDISSRAMRTGFTTKAGYFVVIILANSLDQAMIQDAPVLRTVAVWFYISVEGVSVLENLAIIGVPVPQQVVSRLQQVKEKAGIKHEAESTESEKQD